jgi:hypothetical protein
MACLTVMSAVIRPIRVVIRPPAVSSSYLSRLRVSSLSRGPSRLKKRTWASSLTTWKTSTRSSSERLPKQHAELGGLEVVERLLDQGVRQLGDDVGGQFRADGLEQQVAFSSSRFS